MSGATGPAAPTGIAWPSGLQATFASFTFTGAAAPAGPRGATGVPMMATGPMGPPVDDTTTYPSSADGRTVFSSEVRPGFLLSVSAWATSRSIFEGARILSAFVSFHVRFGDRSFSHQLNSELVFSSSPATASVISEKLESGARGLVESLEGPLVGDGQIEELWALSRRAAMRAYACLAISPVASEIKASEAPSIWREADVRNVLET